jgi:diguanylate cyclase (GGDEF)-like protein/PAS domain S-box-containing protein
MKLTAIPRITLGLVSLGMALLLAFDLLLHLFPSEADTTRELRTRLANSLAIQTAALLQARDIRTIDRTLAGMQSRDPEIESIGLRRADGALLSVAGDHARRWVAPANGTNTLNEMAVGIMSQEQRWGTLEISFRPIHQRALGEWLFTGPTKLLVLFSVSAGLLYFVYLRRMLQHLDPSAAVPERVRGAFDALTEGVLIVDAREQILLANQRFQALSPDSKPGELMGKKASELGWLQPVHADTDATPWRTTMRTRSPVQGQSFQIMHDGAATAKVFVNCSPLLDEQRGVRGCLITLDDVTALERSHEQLLEVLADLATSKQQLELKNTELEDLANIDALSGCLNRRAFFAGLEKMFRHAALHGSDLVCIMADIDHFKTINDRYGHAVGDEAIWRFAEVLRNCVRQGDLVGRYGGEEFCIVIAEASLDRAIQLAETMRRRIAADRSIAGAAGNYVALSASFGVTSIGMGAKSESELVDQADRAMYLAKQSGRNRVVAFSAQTQEEDRTVGEATP